MLNFWKFADKRPNEKIIFVIKQHPIILLKGFLLDLLILIIVIIIAYFKFSLMITLISILIGLMLIAGITIYNIIVWYNNLYILTDERLIDVDQKGLFSQTVAETTLDQIQEVKVEKKGVLQSVFGFGKVIIQTAGPSENIIFEVVAKPYQIEEIIQKYFCEYRKRIGIIDKTGD